MLRAYINSNVLLRNEAGEMYESMVQQALIIGALPYRWHADYCYGRDAEGYYTSTIAVTEVEAPAATHDALGLIPGITPVTERSRLSGMLDRGDASTKGDRVVEMLRFIEPRADLARIERVKVLYE
jgi:hypothetical protein